MRHHTVFTLLSAGWAEMKNNYFLWLLGLVIIDLPAFLLYLTAPNTNHTLIDKISVFLVGIVAATWFHSMGKYFLTIIRNPELVKRYIGRALQYSIVDGVPKRWMYHFFNSALRVTALSIYLNLLSLVTANSLLIYFVPLLSVFVLLPHLYFVDSIFFLCSFVIQDTCSDDNELPALSYWDCLKESAQLMKGYKGRYVCLTLAQYIIILIVTGICYIFAFFTLGFVYAFTLMGGIVLIAIVLGLILGTFFQTFFLAPRFIFGNLLIEDDPDIVDFGE